MTGELPNDISTSERQHLFDTSTKFLVSEDTLFKRSKNPGEPPLVVMPSDFQVHTMYAFHDTVVGRHQGMDKTYHNLSRVC